MFAVPLSTLPLSKAVTRYVCFDLFLVLHKYSSLSIRTEKQGADREHRLINRDKNEQGNRAATPNRRRQTHRQSNTVQSLTRTVIYGVDKLDVPVAKSVSLAQDTLELQSFSGNSRGSVNSKGLSMEMHGEEGTSNLIRWLYR